MILGVTENLTGTLDLEDNVRIRRALQEKCGIVKNISRLVFDNLKGGWASNRTILWRPVRVWKHFKGTCDTQIEAFNLYLLQHLRWNYQTLLVWGFEDFPLKQCWTVWWRHKHCLTGKKLNLLQKASQIIILDAEMEI